MDGGGSVFTQVSRFLAQGGLLEEFVDVQSTGLTDELDALDLEDITGERRSKNKEFLQSLDEYFRDE